MSLADRFGLVGILLVAGCGAAERTESVPESVELSVSDFASLDSRALNFRGAELERVYQDKLAECLLAEGFEFVATYESEEAEAEEMAQFLESNGGNSLEARFPDSDLAATQGFGLYIGWLNRLERSLLEDEIGSSDPNIEYLDPNIEYLDDLSAGEKEAYNSARFGPGGCEEIADQRSGVTEFFELTDLAAEVSTEVFQRLDADPEVLSRVGEFEACMAIEGFALEGPFDVFAIADSYYLEALELLDPEPGVSTEDLERLLERPLQDERALAMATAGCETKTRSVELAAVRYQEILEEVLESRGLD